MLFGIMRKYDDSTIRLLHEYDEPVLVDGVPTCGQLQDSTSANPLRLVWLKLVKAGKSAKPDKSSNINRLGTPPDLHRPGMNLALAIAKRKPNLRRHGMNMALAIAKPPALRTATQ